MLLGSEENAVYMTVNRKALLNAIIGSAAFWVPSVILHALRGADFSLLHWGLLGFMELFSTLAAFLTLCLALRVAAASRVCALLMLLGIWVLGPSWMFISFTFDEGGFAKSWAWLGVLTATVLFPIVTPLMSFYDGSLMGLLITTAVLGLAALELPPILAKRKPESTPRIGS